MMPKTLFARITLTFSLLLFVFVLLASSVIFYYIMTPMVRQSASHLAALVALSSQTWVELPPKTRQDFELELKHQHGIILSSEEQKFQSILVNTPFFNYFKYELQQHLGNDVQVLEEYKPDFWIWVKVPIATRVLYVGFSHDIVGPNPPIVFFILMTLGSLLVIISSLVLVSYLVRPINNLLVATKQLGQGTSPELLAETGPQELVQLTQSFNTMNGQIQELLKNRTVLLAGISHDLRTPIARIRLATEMLDEQHDQSLIESINNDLEDMNQLIQRTLDFSKGLEVSSEKYQTIYLNQYLSEYIQTHPHHSLILLDATKYEKNNEPLLSLPLGVLERILNNLLENAFHYSNKQMITIKLQYQKEACCIHILDQGSGIPEDQLKMVFQPFYRLEASRNTQTGGSGLGLAIVQQLCKAHGWNIHLNNRKTKGLEAILALSF